MIDRPVSRREFMPLSKSSMTNEFFRNLLRGGGLKDYKQSGWVTTGILAELECCAPSVVLLNAFRQII